MSSTLIISTFGRFESVSPHAARSVARDADRIKILIGDIRSPQGLVGKAIGHCRAFRPRSASPSEGLGLRAGREALPSSSLAGHNATRSNAGGFMQFWWGAVVWLQRRMD